MCKQIQSAFIQTPTQTTVPEQPRNNSGFEQVNTASPAIDQKDGNSPIKPSNTNKSFFSTVENCKTIDASFYARMGDDGLNQDIQKLIDHIFDSAKAIPSKISHSKAVKGLNREAIIIDAYAKLQNISDSATRLNQLLNENSSKICGRAVLNVLTDFAESAINFGMAAVVPPIANAPAAIAGITGTVAGDAVNRTAQHALHSDLSHSLDTGEQHNNVLNDGLSDAKEYAAAVAHGNTHPFGFGTVQNAAGPSNTVSANLDQAINWTYFRGDIAKKVFHSIDTAKESINRLQKQGCQELEKGKRYVELSTANLLATKVSGRDTPNVKIKGLKLPSPIATAAELIAPKIISPQTIINKAEKALSNLSELRDTALLKGYPARYVSEHWGPDQRQIELEERKQQQAESDKQLSQMLKTFNTKASEIPLIDEGNLE